MTMLAEAGLSYLGIGVEAPTASWGSMIATLPLSAQKPHTFCCSWRGAYAGRVQFQYGRRWLENALDPRLRGVL